MSDHARMEDPFGLERFVVAQEHGFAQVLDELGAGHKTGHWMWFVFPQLRGLGHSPMARRFGIASLDEARAYLAHPRLGPRLELCVRLVLRIDARAIDAVFAPPDDLKFHSCVTLFARAAPGASCFQEALQRYFGGSPDQATLQLLGR